MADGGAYHKEERVVVNDHVPARRLRTWRPHEKEQLEMFLSNQQALVLGLELRSHRQLRDARAGCIGSEARHAGSLQRPKQVVQASG
jgi:hypothetical protein